MLQTKQLQYFDGNIELHGYYAFDDTNPTARPAILVAPDWSGRNEFACQKAEALAKLGYVGFAVDMYGNGKTGKSIEEKKTLMTPLIIDRGLLAQRILSAFHTIKKIEQVDSSRIGAIGFCFGGLCVLDLARSGADVTGVVSFHGTLLPPPNSSNKPNIKAKIVVLHGHDDPMVPPPEVLQFQNEMTTAKVDWQMVIYGDTKHAFTNPLANDDKLGTVYKKMTAERSWLFMKNFFAEIFGSE